jgi:hypothetical protein
MQLVPFQSHPPRLHDIFEIYEEQELAGKLEQESEYQKQLELISQSKSE